jgi:hypothetical protein
VNMCVGRCREPHQVTLHVGHHITIFAMRRQRGLKEVKQTSKPPMRGHHHPAPPSSVSQHGEATDGKRETLNKSCQRRAYAQRIVTTRLLYHLHDPAELISRMQRIYPRALSNCHTSARTLNFHQGSNANLLGFRARGLFVFLYDVRGEIVTFWHGF